MKFVCTVFEQGDEMLTLLSMEKNNGRMQPEYQFRYSITGNIINIKRKRYLWRDVCC